MPGRSERLQACLYISTSRLLQKAVTADPAHSAHPLEPSHHICCPHNMKQNKSLDMSPQLHTRLLSAVELMMLTSMCTPQAVKVSPQASLHVPSLQDLHVKEGQRPRTNTAVATSLLMSSLGVRVGDKLKAKQQVQLGCWSLSTCTICNAALQLLCVPSVTHMHCRCSFGNMLSSCRTPAKL